MFPQSLVAWQEIESFLPSSADCLLLPSLAVLTDVMLGPRFAGWRQNRHPESGARREDRKGSSHDHFPGNASCHSWDEATKIALQVISVVSTSLAGMATSADLSPNSNRKQRTASGQRSPKGDSFRKSSRPASAGPPAAPGDLPTLLVSDSSSAPFPSRVVGWRTSKSFSRTTSSLDTPSTSHMKPPLNSSSRPAAIRIQMMEPVGPSAYSLSLQAQRTPSEQWKMLKNRLLRKKSSEEGAIADHIENKKQGTRSPQDEGIVFRTNELKRLLRESEASEGGDRQANRSSFDESAQATGEPLQSKNSSDSERDEEGTDSSSKVKWDEVSVWRRAAAAA